MICPNLHKLNEIPFTFTAFACANWRSYVICLYPHELNDIPFTFKTLHAKNWRSYVICLHLHKLIEIPFTFETLHVKIKGVIWPASIFKKKKKKGERDSRHVQHAAREYWSDVICIYLQKLNDIHVMFTTFASEIWRTDVACPLLP